MRKCARQQPRLLVLAAALPEEPPWLARCGLAGLLGLQRPQQLATRFPDHARILFVEPWTLGHGAVPRPARVDGRIARVSFPFLPLHARSLRLRRTAYRLGSLGPAMSVLHAAQRAWIATLRGFFRRDARRLALVVDFMEFPTLDAWRPDRVVYDMIDAPFHFAPVPPRLTPYWEALLARADRGMIELSVERIELRRVRLIR